MPLLSIYTARHVVIEQRFRGEVAGASLRLSLVVVLR